MADRPAVDTQISWSNKVQVAVPGQALLQLASGIVWELDQSYISQQEQVEANDDVEGNGYCELMSSRADLSHTQYRLDPYRWALDGAKHGEPRPTSLSISPSQPRHLDCLCTGGTIEPEEAKAEVYTRLEHLFGLGTIPKANHIIALAVDLRRKTRKLAASQAEEEDSLLDLLGFRSTQKLCKHLFELVQPGKS